MNEENYYITLNCWECDHEKCRLGEIVHENDKDGCVRQVDEKLYIDYYHQLKEVWPFVLQLKDKDKVMKEYNQTLSMLNKVYNSPCTKQYGQNFKVVVGD